MQHLIKEISDFLNIEFLNIIEDSESREYYGLDCSINNNHIKFRKAKLTPIKNGQFVTFWKRNSNMETEPYDFLDLFDFYLIYVQKESKRGIFVFPKDILKQKKVISNNNNEGKRGFRVYPNWDKAESAQAKKTQLWQSEYFFNFEEATNLNFNDFLKNNL